MKLKWKIKYNENGLDKSLSGEKEFSKECNIVLPLENEINVESILGEIDLPLSSSDRTWCNGYQTWTYNKEMEKNDKERGLNHLPKSVINHFGLDRYGDYNFYNYSNKRGVSHGFGFMTIRNGNNFVLLGSKDEDSAWTIFQIDRKKNKLFLSRDTKGAKRKEKLVIFSLINITGNEESVYSQYFKALGMEKPKTKKMAGYSSWYNHYEDINTTTIEEDLTGCKRILKEGDLFQIDDGWEVAVGEWREDKVKFPNGMKCEVDRIKSEGYVPGLWLAPFSAEKDSFIYKEHNAWFLKDESGLPYREGSNWSGFYALDIDNKEVVEYLKDVFNTVFNKWGFEFVKLDFLYSSSPYGKNGETRAERMKRSMLFLRALCGDKLMLSCGTPTFSSFSIADYSRVSCDVSLSWDDKMYMRLAHKERVSTKHALETSFRRRYFSLGAYLTDPDVFFLRKENIKLSEKQKDILSTFDALYQGLFLTSDNPSTYDDETIEKYKKLRHIFESAEDIYSEYIDKKKKTIIHYTLDGKDNTLELPF